MEHPTQVLYAPGQEPEALRQKLQRLMEKLDSAYPDKRLAGLSRDHPKWSDKVSELYQALGYPDRNAFLNAYGYEVAPPNRGGRKRTLDPQAILEVLKRHYPADHPAGSMIQIREECPELTGPLKTLSNDAAKLLGMSLSNYLKQEGILTAQRRTAPRRAKLKYQRYTSQEAQTEFVRLKASCPQAPSLVKADDLEQAHPDLDWDAIRAHVIYTDPTLSLQQFLIQEGLLVDQQALLDRVLDSLRDRYRNAGLLDWPCCMQELQAQVPELDLKELEGLSRAVHRSSADKLLRKEGLLKDWDDLLPREARQKMMAFFPTLKQAGQHPHSMAQLRQLCPDMPLEHFYNLAVYEYDMFPTEYLLQQGVLEMSPAQLWEYENYRFWVRHKYPKFTLFHHIRFQGNRFALVGQYAAPEIRERYAELIRERGGQLTDSRELRQVDCIIGIHPGRHSWGRKLELDGHPLLILSSALLDRLADHPEKED